MPFYCYNNYSLIILFHKVKIGEIKGHFLNILLILRPLKSFLKFWFWSDGQFKNDLPG